MFHLPSDVARPFPAGIAADDPLGLVDHHPNRADGHTIEAVAAHLTPQKESKHPVKRETFASIFLFATFVFLNCLAQVRVKTCQHHVFGKFEDPMGITMTAQ